MTSDTLSSEYYRRREEEALRAGDASPLPNVRAMHYEAARKWRKLAARAEIMENQRARGDWDTAPGPTAD